MMNEVLVYTAVSIGFLLLVAVGAREKRKPSDADGHIFRYQRSAVLAIGACSVVWFIIALAIPLISSASQKGMKFTALSAAVYIIFNALMVASYFYYYKWLQSYSLKINDSLTICSIRGVRHISFSSILKAYIIEGKNTTTMHLFFNDGKKIILSGLLVDSNLAFKEIANKLMISQKCNIKKRSYIGHWTTIQ